MKTLLKKGFVVLAALSLSIAAMAQASTEDVQSVSINILGLEYAYEQALGSKSTVTWHGGLGGELGYSYTRFGSYENDQWHYSVRATAGADLRYYYNLAKRDRKGKNTRRNSANFLSADLVYYTTPLLSKNLDGDHAVFLAPSWGLRRVYSNNLFLEFKLGLSVGVQGSEWAIGPHTTLVFGYTF